MTKRSIVAFILLSLFTCGIYSIYWYYVTTEELNEKDSSIPDITNFIIAILLSIITCGIYGIFWQFKFYQKANAVTNTDHVVLYFILTLLGFSIVSDALVQNDFNELKD